MGQKKIVGVIGGHHCIKEVEYLAHNLGLELAKVVDILVSGGLCGTMAAVSQGFKEGNGLTIGFLPSYDKKDSNKFVDIAIPTGMGLARNLLVVKSADVVIALPGQAGTLSEIAYCLQFNIPVIALIPSHLSGKSHLTLKFLKGQNIPGVIIAKNISQVIAKVRKIIKQ